MDLMKFIPNRQQWLMFIWKAIMFALIFLNLWIWMDQEALPPNGNLFHLLMLFIFSHLFGQLSALIHLPPLFGMLVAGFIYGNVIDFKLDKTLSSTIRSLALIIILIRAGLNLDPKAIKRLSFICARLSLLPSLIEAITVAIFAWLVYDFDLSWSLMLGFVIGSVSPAVVVPSMVDIQEAKYGIRKGIPTLLIASGSVDNVFAITGFSVCLSFALKSGQSSDFWQTFLALIQGPVEALAGVIFGIIIGMILWHLPVKYNHREASEYEVHRFALMIIAALFLWFGSQSYNYRSVGPLAILTAPFVASIRWSSNDLGDFSKKSLKLLWIIFEHFLFCLISSDVRIKDMDTSILIYGTLCILLGCLIRMAAAYFVTYSKTIGFNARERLFISISWLPKATIQAAMGPIALDLATEDDDIKKGHLILTLAVLSIILTAPIGAIAINQTYPYLLEYNNDDDDVQHQDNDHPTELLNRVSSSKRIDITPTK